MVILVFVIVSFIAFFASESALLFPGIPRWLEIQEKIISLFLDKWYILLNTFLVKGSLRFLFCNAVSADKSL